MMKKILFMALALAIPGFAFAAGNTLSGPVGVLATTRVGTQAVTPVVLNFADPHQVWRYRVQCANATYITVQVADCCIAGDKWRAEVDIKDTKPNDGVAIATGVPLQYSDTAVARTFGVTPLDALVSISYPHGGVNIWPAGLYLQIVTTGTCIPVVTALGATYK